MGENKDVNPSEQVADSPATVQSKDEDKHQSKEVAKTTDKDVPKGLTKQEIAVGINTLNLFDEKQLAAAEVFLGKVIKSKTGGITTVADGLGILMRANDLGLPFSTCIEHIHVINGKTGVDIHIVKALLSRAGCTWRTVKDYQPLYEYTDGFSVYNDGDFPEYVVRCNNPTDAATKAAEDKTGEFTYAYPVKWYRDFNGNVYKDYQLDTNKFGVAVNKAQAAEITKVNKIPVYRIPSVAIDYVTEYEITRTLKGKEIKALGRFSFNEAKTADLFSKDTYIKYARTLIGHRAFTYVAREIASDILFGVMETTELKIVSGHELNAKDFGSVEEAEVVDL